MTKALKIRLAILRLIQFLTLALPIILISIRVFNQESHSKTRLLVVCLVVSLILILFNMVAKKRLRCVIWIILVGIIFATEKIENFIIVTAISSTLDDLILTPICDHLKTKLIASQTIDERLKYERES